MRRPVLPSSLYRLVVLFLASATLHSQVDSGARRPIARLGNETIYEENLPPAVGGQSLQLENQEYELKVKALTDLVNRRVVEAEAKNSGITVEEFLVQNVDRDLPPWSVSELKGFYLARKDSIKKPFDEVRPELEKAFLEARREQARQEFIDQLRQKAGVTVLLLPPRARIAVDPSRLRGSSDAPVTILEFGDFQCPYCQSLQAVLKEILVKYRGKVRLGFRDFPLREIHPQAQAAAEAARCAGEQGKFWEYHDLLFTKHAGLDPAGLVEHAHAAGLDVGQFSACLASGKVKSLIEYDVSLGKAFGVAGTPTVYINGILITGSQPAAGFEKVIDSELVNAQSRKSAP